jgi:hypothetical protein
MSNLSPASPIGPLSVGNVVSASVRIYRSHLKQYLTLSLIAYLWILVPVYGWAKTSAISGLISRLAYGELADQPESVADARRFTDARKWRFLGAGILLGLIFIGLYFGMAIVVGILFATSIVVGPIGAILGIIGAIAALLVLIRIYSRLFIFEVPIALEEHVDATTALGRSWDLTKGSVGRVQWVVTIAFLITLAVQVPVRIFNQVLAVALPSGDGSLTAAGFIAALLIFTIAILSAALVMPFWQVIKAVIYYDLRARREGLGLRLRDR